MNGVAHQLPPVELVVAENGFAFNRVCLIGKVDKDAALFEPRDDGLRANTVFGEQNNQAVFDVLLRLSAQVHAKGLQHLSKVVPNGTESIGPIKQKNRGYRKTIPIQVIHPDSGGNLTFGYMIRAKFTLKLISRAKRRDEQNGTSNIF